MPTKLINYFLQKIHYVCLIFLNPIPKPYNSEWKFISFHNAETIAAHLGVSMGQVGLYYFIIFLDPIRLNSGQKNLNSYPTQSGHGSTRPDPCKIINYLLIIFI
jgi:hypothetical protein